MIAAKVNDDDNEWNYTLISHWRIIAKKKKSMFKSMFKIRPIEVKWILDCFAVWGCVRVGGGVVGVGVGFVVIVFSSLFFFTCFHKITLHLIIWQGKKTKNKNFQLEIMEFLKHRSLRKISNERHIY